MPASVLLLTCAVLLLSCGGDEASGSPSVPTGHLAKVILDGEAQGGRLTLLLRGPGGPPLDVSVPTHAGEPAQAVADRLTAALRASAWPEGVTWKPWVVGVRITHADEVLFRCTDRGLNVYVNMGTLLPRRYAVSVRGEEPETATGNLLVSGSSPSSEVTVTQNLFSVGHAADRLLDEVTERLEDGGWVVEQRDAVLECRGLPAGGAPTYMSVYLRRGGPGGGAAPAADWTWGLTLLDP